MHASHPLIVLPRKDVFKRRPRLTNQEALVLNALVNADGEPVTVDTLLNVLWRGKRHYDSYRKTVTQVVSTLRAKLGEEVYRPTQIQTVYVERRGRTVVAYRYVETD